MQVRSIPFSIFFCVCLVSVFSSCGISKRVRLDPESQDFYETARLVMTKQEKDIFLHLPDQKSREEFIADFWAKRDPDPETEENEFREEFFRRIEYANAHFREGIPGWKTDRGRVYIYLGHPDKIEDRPFINRPDIKGIIWWGYYRYRLAVEFIDTRGDGSYIISQQVGDYGNLLQMIEKAKFGQIYVTDEGKAYIDFNLRYDRGKKEIVVSIPMKSLIFKSEDKVLKADIAFQFYIYGKESLKKEQFKEVRHFEKTEDEVARMEEIIFSFPHDLESGKYYIDVLITMSPDLGKGRKIFEIKS